MTGTLGFRRGVAAVSPVVAGLLVGAAGCSNLADDDDVFWDHALKVPTTVKKASSRTIKNGARIFLHNCCMMTSKPVVLLLATLTGCVADAAKLKFLFRDVFPAADVGMAT
jgi:hypothetical protein